MMFWESQEIPKTATPHSQSNWVIINFQRLSFGERVNTLQDSSGLCAVRRFTGSLVTLQSPVSISESHCYMCLFNKILFHAYLPTLRVFSSQNVWSHSNIHPSVNLISNYWYLPFYWLIFTYLFSHFSKFQF